MNETILEIKNLSFAYDSFSDEKEVSVLKDISLSVKKGETVGLAGANGAGKSTLLKLLTGLLTASEGEIKICGIQMKKSALPEIRKRSGYVFQDSDSQLFMPTVYADIAFGLQNYGCDKTETDKRVKDALSLVGAEHLSERSVYKLSGGEKKLVSIAAVLALSPQILFMDEPTIALDPKNRRNLIRILNELKTAKFIASHDLDMLLDTCDRVVLLSEGKIAAEGETKEILSNKELLETYGLELPLIWQG